MTERWPIDVETLQKGDVISIERLEVIIGRPRGAPGFGLEVLKIREMIARQLEVIGRPMTIRQLHGQLVLCDDETASVYNPREVEAGWRKSARAHRRNLAVDVSQLDQERRAQHDRTLVTHSRIFQAMRSARVDPELQPATRNTPPQGNREDE